MLLHIHKQLTDFCDLVQIANEFIVANPEKRNYLGVLQTLNFNECKFFTNL